MSMLPPPPPQGLPPPPPPPPPHLPPPPPPPPPTASATPEEKGRIKDALASAAATLEKGRCLETELQATALISSSLMKHPPTNEFSVDVSSLPGGIRDAWCIISDASVKNTDEVTNASALTIDHSIPDGAKKEKDLPLGRGQLGRSVHITALADCIQRGNALAKQVKDQKEKEGPSLKRSLNTAKSLAGYEDIWLQIFDEKLQHIQGYHARHAIREERVISKRQKLGNPATDGYDLASTAAEAVAHLQDGTLFNEEEVMGKYLDLQHIYDSFATIVRKLARVPEQEVFTLFDLVAFLARGSLSSSIAEADKLNDRKHYVRLLSSLQNYLEEFIKRVSPLLNTQDVVKPAVDELVKQWSGSGGTDGWEAKLSEAPMVEAPSNADASSSDQTTAKGIDLAPFASATDLENAVDGDKLKVELARLGLKCGGTTADRARRLFMTKDTPLDNLPKKLFAKKKSSNGAPGTAVAAKSERRVDVARREKVVMALLDHVRPTLEATLRRLERQQAQTLNEREQELEEELHGSAVDEDKKPEKGEDDESDEDDAPIYNPKGVPLGWDGKPIPYWLFKLHGLNHFYPCEVCGNESYRGRRNFELHFTEAKHAYGMKCLGIPNTKHFHGVTKIEDAQSLWKKLQGQLNDDKKEEEYEDSHGNVLSRAAYEDLARQGLL